MSGTSASTPARGVVASWLYTVSTFVAVLILGAIVVILDIAQIDGPAWLSVLVLVVLAGVLLGLPLLRAGLHQGFGGHPVQRVGLAVALGGSLVLLGYAFIARPDFSLGTLPLAMSVSVMACLLPRRATFVLLVLVSAIAALHMAVFDPPNGILAIFMAVFFAFTIYMSMWAWNVVLRLDDARKTERDLALTQERLRFANELHDAQGHTLQVLALKTELAERLLDADPEAAREQLRDARQLAADALANTRSIARGYQRVSLEDELANAMDVLEAAGATCELRVDDAPADGAAKELIARLVREGTTNLLRHATAATRASIEVTAEPSHWVVRMRNNGLEATPVEPVETPGTSTSSATAPVEPVETPDTSTSSATGSGSATEPGSGIAGLRTAFREAGGDVETRIHDNEFMLIGRLPR